MRRHYCFFVVLLMSFLILIGCENKTESTNESTNKTSIGKVESTIITATYDEESCKMYEFKKIAANGYSIKVKDEYRKTIEEAIIPETYKGCKVIEIEEFGFESCKNLRTVQISKEITVIRDYAFSRCEKLEEMYIPKTVKTVGYRIIDYCPSIKSFIIEDGVKSIDRIIFYHTNDLEKVSLPSDVYEIDVQFEFETYEDFKNYKGFNVYENGIYVGNETNPYQICVGIIQDENEPLIDLNINPNTKTVGLVAAFNNNRAGNEQNFKDIRTTIRSLYIPSSVAYIYPASQYFTTLSTIRVDESNPIYDSRENCNCIVKTEKNEIVTGSLSSSIPSSIKRIGNASFLNLAELKKIEIPSNVTRIGQYAFWHCFGLETIIFNEGLTEIGMNAFNGCTSLIEVTIPSTVTIVGSYCFQPARGLKKVTIKGKTIPSGWAYDWASRNQDMLEIVFEY